MAIKSSPFRAMGGDIIPTPMGDLTLEIIGSGQDAELLLLQIAADLEDRHEPLIASARILANDMQRRFDTETDPDGEPWVPLDEEYLANKVSLGYPEDILHRTGALEKAATSIDAYILEDDTIFFDPGVLPDYGLIHQTGSNVENAGLASRHRFRAADDANYVKEEGGGHTNLGIGRGNALPARPFIGMSEVAEGEIWKFFDLWFEDATTPGSKIAVSSTGHLQTRIRGRFGPKLVL